MGIFGSDADRHAARRRQRIGEWHRDGKSVLVSSLDGPDGNRYDRNNRVWQEEGDFILTAGRAVAPLCRGHTRDV